MLRTLVTQLSRPLDWLGLPRPAYLFPWPYEVCEQEVLERELFDHDRIANDNARRADDCAEPVRPTWVRIR
ncbi:MAG TPA: hypothetical protein VFQ53_30835 [Kofleriaceae bacterium]|nr:hypothetical protein [Kofleriaceae bacterium]